MITIPLFDFPAFKIEIELDNIPYILSFQWNTMGEFWSLTFYDNNNILLLSGIKLVLNYELISDYHDLNLPSGELYIIDPTGNDSPIVYDDFLNSRLELIYVEESERDSV